jgi:hypothetical protein
MSRGREELWSFFVPFVFARLLYKLTLFDSGRTEAQRRSHDQHGKSVGQDAEVFG